jgi:hypothetical protein
VSIYDTEKKVVLYQTFGTLSANTTLSYERLGLQIVVASIAPIPQRTSSPPISVTLERSVSYEIQLTPASDEFEFDPPVLTFLPS